MISRRQNATESWASGGLGVDRPHSQMRMVAVGRKNYLFAGSDAAAHRACIHYTLICSARLSEIDPRAYLTDLYQKLADGWPQRKLDELLPTAWGECHPGALIATRPA
jgi:hypothetical protein